MSGPFCYTDNERANEPIIDGKFIETLDLYAWQTMETLSEDNPGLLVFPPDFESIKDGLKDQSLFELEHRKSGAFIRTGNIVGMFGLRPKESGCPIDFQIKSRFDPDNRQFFLFYLLERVFGIHSLDLVAQTDNRNHVINLAVCLFPFALKAALAKGLYKTYRTFHRNDDTVTGSLEVDRHIQENIPFRGTIAYSSRERSSDNHLIQLVRHTIEHIAASAHRSVLSSGKEIRDSVALIREATPTYLKSRRSEIIARNLRVVRHPYYSEYTYLQKVCLMILRDEQMSYSMDGKSEIYGLVFMVDWLWEEYLASVLTSCKLGDLSHPRNRDNENKKCIYLIHGNRKKGRSLPDFMLRMSNYSGIRDPCDSDKQDQDAIFDAKYKRLSSKNGRYACVQRDDRFQMISYLHATKARYGLFLFPKTPKETIFVSEDDETPEGGELKDKPLKYGTVCGYEWLYRTNCRPEIWIVPFVVPEYNDSIDYPKFRDSMRKSEESFLRRLRSVFQSVEDLRELCHIE